MENNKIVTLRQLSAETGISANTLKVKIHIGKMQGIEPPLRCRAGKHYLYDYDAFMKWLWEHADALRREYPKTESDATKININKIPAGDSQQAKL